MGGLCRATGIGRKGMLGWWEERGGCRQERKDAHEVIVTWCDCWCVQGFKRMPTAGEGWRFKRDGVRHRAGPDHC